MQTFLFLSPSSVIAIVTMVVVGEHVDQQERCWALHRWICE